MLLLLLLVVVVVVVVVVFFIFILWTVTVAVADDLVFVFLLEVYLDVIFPLTFALIKMPLLFPDMSVDPWFHTIPVLCAHWLKPQDHRAKLAQTVPFKVAINISRPDRLVQTASYMPESQLHLHSCNNEPMNPALLEKAERLESIRMDCRGEGRSDLDSLHSQKSFPKFEFIWMPMGFLQNPSPSPAQVVLLICRKR